MSQPVRPASYTMSIVIIGMLFFIFGFVTWINGTLIPYLKIACQLESDFQSYLVVTAFFIAYTVMAIPSSYVLTKTGYKKGMAIGLFIMALGAIVFVPAASTRNYNLFLVGYLSSAQAWRCYKQLPILTQRSLGPGKVQRCE